MFVQEASPKTVQAGKSELMRINGFAAGPRLQQLVFPAAWSFIHS